MAVFEGHAEVHSQREQLFVSKNRRWQNDPHLLQMRTYARVRSDYYALRDGPFCQHVVKSTSFPKGLPATIRAPFAVWL